MELFKLLGTIAVDNAEAKKALQDVSQEGQQTESKLGKFFGGIGKGAAVVGKTIATGLAAGATACVGLATAAINSYADYEQLVGGVETLFGTRGAKSVEEYAKLTGQTVDYVRAEFEMLQEAESNVMKNASNAYKTAGLSMNEYMETASGLAAALNQSSASQLESAALADQAIIDMADNSAKMGTSMEAIQNAYAGFSKQNYTMLDNLKLGYGGTKEEMQRLLKDAEAISGIKYDISSFADVTEAIHVMQEEMGIAGTTAKEASSTIQGSFGMLKGSWSNLMVGLSDPEADLTSLINNVFSSVTTFAGNLIPRVTQVLSGIATAFSTLVPMIAGEIPNLLNQVLPPIVEGAVALVDGLVSALPGVISAIQAVLPELIAGLQTIFVGLVEAIIAAAPLLIDGLMGLIDALVGALPQVITAIVTALPTLIPQLIDGFVSAIMMLVEMLPQIIQPLIDNLPEVIISIVEALVNNLPVLIEGCISLIMGIVTAIPQIIQALVDALPTIISLLTQALLNNLPTIILGLIQCVIGIVAALPQIFASLIQAVPLALAGVWDGIVSVFSNLGGWFSNLFSGVAGIFKTAWDGIKGIVSSVVNAIWNVIKTVWDSIKNTISGVLNGIKSVITTVWNAIKSAISTVLNAIKSVVSSVWNSIKSAVSTVLNGIKSVVSTAWNAIKSAISTALNAIKSVVTTIWNGIKSAISTALDAIKSVVSSVWNAIKSAISTVLNSIKSVITNAWNNIKSAISNALNSIKSAVTNAWNTIKSAISNVLTSIVETVKSGASKMLEAGKDLIRGIWEGISGSLEWIKGKITGWVGNVTSFVKKLFGIKSPSTLWRDEIGKELARGVAVGIEAEISAVEDSAAKLGDKTLAALRRTISDDVINSTIATIPENTVEALESKFDAIETYNDLTLADEIAYWNRARKLFKDGTDERIKLDKKYFAAVEKLEAEKQKFSEDQLKEYEKLEAERRSIEENRVKTAQNQLDNYKVYNELTLADEVAFWDSIRQACQEGTDVRIEADKKYFEAKKTMNEKLVAAEKKLQDSLNAIYEKIEKRKSEILGSFDLFSEYTKGNEKPASYREMEKSLDQQIEVMELYDEELKELEEKIGGTAFFEEIEKMGFAGLSQIQELNKLQDFQLNSILEKYNKRADIADRMAKEELGMETIQATNEAYQEFATTLDTIGIEVEGATTYMRDIISTAFTEITSNVETATSKTVSAMGLFANVMTASLNSIKEAFGDWQDNFKIPHFSLKGSLDLESGSVPEIDVSWYKKAMSNATILDKPTIFGYSAKSGSLLGGGEAGNEVVAGEQTLMQMIQGAVAANNSELIAVLTNILKAILKMDGNMSANLRDALESTSFAINNREFARLVKAVK